MQQQNDNQSSGGDELDRLLDAALKKYGAVQARPGLEGRILAQLRTQSAEPASRAWWSWVSAAAAVAALALFSSMLSRPHPKPQPSVAQHRLVTLPAPKVAASSEPKPVIHRPKSLRHATRDTRVVHALPKLNQFPSPQPLSEQEKLLASYVAVYPKQAALLAKLRAEEAERERMEERSKSPSRDTAPFEEE